MTFEDKGSGNCEVKFDSVSFNLTENSVEITTKKDVVIKNLIGKTNDFSPTVKSVCDNELVLSYKGNEYAVKLLSGKYIDKNSIESTNCKIIAEFTV